MVGMSMMLDDDSCLGVLLLSGSGCPVTPGCRSGCAAAAAAAGIWLLGLVMLCSVNGDGQGQLIHSIRGEHHGWVKGLAYDPLGR